jgi:hypothetical protein
MNRLLVIAGLFLVVGCGPVTREYTINVKNDFDQPMTIVLTKDGPPMDLSWLPPEDLAAMRNAPPEAHVNGVVIPPGKSAEQTRSTQFDSGVSAMLRIYYGEQTPMTMVGVSPGSPNRQDIRLSPGLNTFVIDKSGKAVRQ